MKVRVLIQLLQTCDPEAEASLITQANWPLEHGIAGLATREDCRAEEGKFDYLDGSAPKTITPNRNILRRPKMSPRRPPVTSSTAKLNV